MKKQIMIGLVAMVLLMGCGQTTEETVIPDDSALNAVTDSTESENAADAKTEDVTTDVNDEDKNEDNSVSIGMAYVYDIEHIKPDDMYVFFNTSTIFSESGSLVVTSPTSHVFNSNIDATPRVVVNSNHLVLTEDSINAIRSMAMDFYNTNFADIQGVIDETYVECENKWAKDDTSPLMECSDRFPGELILNVGGNNVAIEVEKCEAKGSMQGSVSGMPDDSPLVKSEQHNDYLMGVTFVISGNVDDLSAINAFYENLGEYQSEKSELNPELKDITFADSITFKQLYGSTEQASVSSDDSSKSKEQPEQTIDLTGTWYDPTRLSYAEFIFNGDGTGTYDFGNGDTRQMTYSVSGNTISYKLPNSSGTLTIKGDKLYDGESYYVKK